MTTQAPMSMARALLTQLALWPVRWLGHASVQTARACTRPLGWVLERTLSRRRRIVDQNLVLCFPTLSQAQRDAIRQTHFRLLGEAVGEMAVAWRQDRPIERSEGYVEGLQHVKAVEATGRGVLLVTGHTVCLEWAARVFAEAQPGCGIYRPLSNPVLERFQNEGRARYAQHMFDRDDVRGMVRHLRKGGVLWYAPDQDFGQHRSVFAPFFGIETATAKALAELARLSRAVVVPMYPIKDPSTGQVVVHVDSPWWDFPSHDAVADASRFNAFLQSYIEKAPAQYWWLHRRFKTTPDGSSRYE